MQKDNIPSDMTTAQAPIQASMRTPLRVQPTARMLTPGESSLAATADGDTRAPLNWNDSKFREEQDTFRGNLIDRTFRSADYPDPLLPFPKPYPLSRPAYPAGVTKELETKLQNVIDGLRAGDQSMKTD